MKDKSIWWINNIWDIIALNIIKLHLYGAYVCLRFICFNFIDLAGLVAYNDSTIAPFNLKIK